MSTAMIRKVGFHFAMEGEAMPLISGLGLSLEKPLPHAKFLKFYRGEVGQTEIVAVCNGRDERFGVDRVGIETSVLATFLLLTTFSPQLLINAGTAGGFQSRGGAIGDLYFSAEPYVFHDHRIGIPGFKEFAEGGYPPGSLEMLGHLVGAKRGKVTTGSSLDATPEDLVRMAQSGATVKDMEGAAVAQIAFDCGVPCFSIKAITDLVDHPETTADVFLRNFAFASEALGKATVKIAKYLGEGRSIKSLGN